MKELQRFNGMVNQLAKFIPGKHKGATPSTAEKGSPMGTAFQDIKQKLTSLDVLAHYEASKRSVVAVDCVPGWTESSPVPD